LPSAFALFALRAPQGNGSNLRLLQLASALPSQAAMLKLLGSIALARLLGFGILGFLVIYLLLSLLT
jgi:hypothetical protein